MGIGNDGNDGELLGMIGNDGDWELLGMMGIGNDLGLYTPLVLREIKRVRSICLLQVILGTFFS